MKISYLHIKNYKHFLDLELDLTYPKGHEKVGKPLDKICIIGQSGTGKTNLLDIIKKSTIDFSSQETNSYLPFFEFVGKNTEDKYITTKFKTSKKDSAESLFTEKSSKIIFKTKTYSILENEKNYFVGTDKCSYLVTQNIFDEKSITRTDKTMLKSLEKERNNIEDGGISLYGSSSIFEKLITDIDKRIQDLKQKYSIKSSIQNIKNNNFLDSVIVNINEENNSWNHLKETINNYEIERTSYTKELTSKLLADDSYSKNDFINNMLSWEEKNQNILEKIADDINNIIQWFNLRLEINEYTQSYDELLIKDLSNNMIIKYDNLSTGTKNLLSTFIPLKSHKPKDSIILIDEPEMSFYPNIQRQLTELYMKVEENNQLIMATHSPLIASSFEPWEVVELKFDENNQIYREKYYEGENHIDNYNIDPRMLTWTGILTDVFDLKEDSNFSFREKKLMEYASLKAEIKAMDNKTNKEAIVKIKQFKKLSQLLGLQN